MKDLIPLIPIIASYYGCQCSYTYFNKQEASDLDGTVLNYLGSLHDFKLHLKKLEDISETDAQEVWNVVFGKFKMDVSVRDFRYSLIDNDKSSTDMEMSDYVEAINKLRQLGYSVDKILETKGLVDWI